MLKNSAMASFTLLISTLLLPLAHAAPTLVLKESSYNPGQAIVGEIRDVAGTSWVVSGAQPLYIRYEWSPLNQQSVSKSTVGICVPWMKSTTEAFTFTYDSAAAMARLSVPIPDNGTPGITMIVLATDQYCTGATTPSGFQILAPGESPLASPTYASNVTVAEPKVGSYSLLANYEGKQFVGYTRVETEGPCTTKPAHLTHGLAFKMSKSSGLAYWAGGAVNMRFCASRKQQEGGPAFLAATGMLSYLYPDDAVVRDSAVIFADQLDTLAVTYQTAPLAPGEELCTGAVGEPGCTEASRNYRGNRNLSLAADFPRAEKSPAVLGGLSTNVKVIDFDRGTVYGSGQTAVNAGFYSLLPPWDASLPVPAYRVPVPNLPGWDRPGLPIVNQEFSAFPNDLNAFSRVDWMGVWRLEALKPDEGTKYPSGRDTFPAMPAGGQSALRMRYLEYGQYNITEDWVWRTNGLVTRISQWWPSATTTTIDVITYPGSAAGKRCWRSPSNGSAPASLEEYQAWCLHVASAGATNPDPQPMSPSRDTRAVELFLADGSALQLNLAGGTLKSVVVPPGLLVWGREIVHGASYEVQLKQSSGQGYSGFLELQAINTNTTSIWRDTHNRPIYFHRGAAVIPAAAYGNLHGQSVFRVRPYWNASVDSFHPQTAPTPPTNGNSGGAWSGYVLLSIQ
jgi:hypothetical protein